MALSLAMIQARSYRSFGTTNKIPFTNGYQRSAAAAALASPIRSGSRIGYSIVGLGQSNYIRPSSAAYRSSSLYSNEPGAALAIRTTHRMVYYDVPNERNYQQQQSSSPIYVDSQPIPITLMMRTYSSPINIQHSHYQGQGGLEETASEDQELRFIHTITKPVVQEVREIISPIRMIYREIQPIDERVETMVARRKNSDSDDKTIELISLDKGSSLDLSSLFPKYPDNDNKKKQRRASLNF